MREGKENPQRFYGLKMEQTPFRLMWNDAVSKIVNLLSGVIWNSRTFKALPEAQEKVRFGVWVTASCLGVAVTRASFIRCGVTASCPLLGVEELEVTNTNCCSFYSFGALLSSSC